MKTKSTENNENTRQEKHQGPESDSAVQKSALCGIGNCGLEPEVVVGWLTWKKNSPCHLEASAIL